MTEPKVWMFFYGSFINRKVLRAVDYVPERFEVARLGRFDIVIRPLANLVRSGRHHVSGIVAPATHDELRRLYDYARDASAAPTCRRRSWSRCLTAAGGAGPPARAVAPAPWPKPQC
jgi:hypothetical protein